MPLNTRSPPCDFPAQKAERMGENPCRPLPTPCRTANPRSANNPRGRRGRRKTELLYGLVRQSVTRTIAQKMTRNPPAMFNRFCYNEQPAESHIIFRCCNLCDLCVLGGYTYGLQVRPRNVSHETLIEACLLLGRLLQKSFRKWRKIYFSTIPKLVHICYDMQVSNIHSKIRSVL